MKKLLTFLQLVVLGCLVAGLYGILHDQLTYTISPEYYTKLKFYQFGFADEGSEANFQNPRLFVSLVGFLATWWMGIPIAAILGLFSLHNERRKMIHIAMKGFLVTMIVAFATGLYGLYKGYVRSNQSEQNFDGWFIPGNLVDFESFIAVGSMHNHSYMGGLFGLLVGIVYIVRRKRSGKMRQGTAAHAHRSKPIDNATRNDGRQ